MRDVYVLMYVCINIIIINATELYCSLLSSFNYFSQTYETHMKQYMPS